MTDTSRQEQQKYYAELLIKIGVNLQPGQALRIGAELAHRDFVRLVSDAAYQAGARYVHVEWIDAPLARSRLLYSQPDYLDFYPEYEVARHREMVDDRWARLALVGTEYPTIFDDIDPTLMRRVAAVRPKKVKFYTQATMANLMQWCVAAVPTTAWAKQIFPDLPDNEVVDKLWGLILQMCRIDQPDPLAAWDQHNRNLKQVAAFMARRKVRSIRYFDPTPGPDGKPATDLTVGLTDRPFWIGGSSQTPAQVDFQPNMPTEEVFTTPHNQRTEGWVRTSKSAFPFDREVSNAYFRFTAGELVEFQAATGQEVLEQFFQIPGSRRLGEISLVDERSPVNQSGLTFHETLFDENAVCHIAFGRAYPEGYEGGTQLSAEELHVQGVNESDTHVDFMIGTSTMQVTGRCLDGQEVVIMHNGQFTPEVLRQDTSFNMVCPSLENFPEYTLPAGYRFRNYRPGDDQTWTEVQAAAEPFITIDDAMFDREFGDQLDALPDRMFFIETDEGRPVGSITAWWDPNWRGTGDWGRIHWVVIHPDFQRRGLTKPMMTHAMHRLAQSHQRATLGTSSGRPWAVKVYLDYGFTPDPSELSNPKIYAAWQQVQSIIHHPVLDAILNAKE